MNRRGFTLVELVTVIMVAAVLLGIVTNAMSGVRNRYAVQQARNAFVALQARARAQAIEYGTNTSLYVDTGGDSVWVSRNDTILERIRLADEFNVDVLGGSTRYRLCMSPRGIADESCNSSSLSSSAAIRFAGGVDTMTVTVSPLGQVTY